MPSKAHLEKQANPFDVRSFGFDLFKAHIFWSKDGGAKTLRDVKLVNGAIKDNWSSTRLGLFCYIKP